MANQTILIAMKQEDKRLLLVDLCARLPYGVKVQDELGRINKLVIGNADLVRLYYDDFSIYSEEQISLPLLRPMSSMTEEEIKELQKISWQFSFSRYDNLAYVGAADDGFCSIPDMEKILSYLNAHHFDYRGLIPKGLAIAVTPENNPYK